MNDEIEYEKMEQSYSDAIHANECMNAILSDNGSSMNLHALYRSIYKYVDCGPWLTAKTWDNREFSCRKLEAVDKDEVRYLLVGSIVEGSDAEVTGEWIDLLECESGEDAVARFWASVDEVNKEACALWEEANSENEEDDVIT